MNEIYLGVNIDHIATLRQARGTEYPSIVKAAQIAEAAGADGITIHLREDRRHIQDADVLALKKTLTTRMNLEMAVTSEMIAIAQKTRPEHVCLVPEKREELTTEGGLDVIANQEVIKHACQVLGESGIEVSLFIDADEDQIAAAKACEAPTIEIHTGHYADALDEESKANAYNRIVKAAAFAADLGLVVNAGHGLHQANVSPIAAITQIHELNIGHALIADALFIGLGEAVRIYKALMSDARAKK